MGKDSAQNIEKYQEFNTPWWLPLEIWQKIIYQLEDKDKYTLREVCQFFNLMMDYKRSWYPDCHSLERLDIKQLNQISRLNYFKKNYLTIKNSSQLSTTLDLMNTDNLIDEDDLILIIDRQKELIKKEGEYSIQGTINAISTLISGVTLSFFYLFNDSELFHNRCLEPGTYPQHCATDQYVNSFKTLMIFYMLIGCGVGFLFKTLDNCLIAPQHVDAYTSHVSFFNNQFTSLKDKIKRGLWKAIVGRDYFLFTAGVGLTGSLIKLDLLNRVNPTIYEAPNGWISPENELRLANDVRSTKSSIIGLSVAEGFLFTYSLLSLILLAHRSIKQCTYNPNNFFQLPTKKANEATKLLAPKFSA